MLKTLSKPRSKKSNHINDWTITVSKNRSKKKSLEGRKRLRNIREENKRELPKHLENIRNRLLYSNAINIFMKDYLFYSYVVKIDITGLKCNICRHDIDGLNSLIDHLQSEHNKTMHTDIKNHILPFKFEQDDTLNCALCHKSYDKFKQLQEHMHAHYNNNYSCERNAHMVKKYGTELHVHKCRASHKTFTLKDKLSRHTKRDRLLEREHGCEHCDKKFHEKRDN